MTQISRLLNFGPSANCKDVGATHTLPPAQPPHVSIRYSAPHERFNPPSNHIGAFPIPAFFPGEDINVTVEIVNAQEVPIADLQLALIGEASVHQSTSKTIRHELLSVGVSLVDKIAMWGGNVQPDARGNIQPDAMGNIQPDAMEVDMRPQDPQDSSMWIPFRPTEALTETPLAPSHRSKQILPPGKYSLPLTITIPFFTNLPSSFRHNTHSISYSISCTLQIPPSTIETLVGISNNSRIFASLALNLIPLIAVPTTSPPIISNEILHPAGSQVYQRRDSNATSTASETSSPRVSPSPWSSVSDLLTSLSSSATVPSSQSILRSGNYALQVYIPRRTFAQNSKIPVSLHVVNHSDEPEGQLFIRRAFIAKALVQPNFVPSRSASPLSRSAKRRRITKRQNLRSAAFAWITTRHRRARRVLLGKDDTEDTQMDCQVDDDDDEDDDDDQPSFQDMPTDTPDDTMLEMWKLSEVDQIRVPTTDSESLYNSREFALSFSLDIPRGCGFTIPTTSTMNLFGISFKVGIEVEFLHGRQGHEIPEDERDIVTIWVPITVGSVKVAEGDPRGSMTPAIDEEELPPPVYEQAVKDVPAYTREASYV